MSDVKAGRHNYQIRHFTTQPKGECISKHVCQVSYRL